jgi:hypothetical protein
MADMGDLKVKKREIPLSLADSRTRVSQLNQKFEPMKGCYAIYLYSTTLHPLPRVGCVLWAPDENGLRQGRLEMLLNNWIFFFKQGKDSKGPELH